MELRLLDEETRALFRRLAVFAGSFDLDAVVAVTAGAREAAMLVDRAFADFPGTWAQPYAQAAGAELAVAAGLPDAADRLRAASGAASGAAAYNHWAAACLARATGRLHHDPGAHAAAIAGWERIGAHPERAYTLPLLPARAAEGHAHLTARGLPPRRQKTQQLLPGDRRQTAGTGTCRLSANQAAKRASGEAGKRAMPLPTRAAASPAHCKQHRSA